MPPQGLQAGVGMPVPDLDGAIAPTANQPLSLGVKSHTVNAAAVVTVGCETVPTAHIPELNGAIATAAGQYFTVWTKRSKHVPSRCDPQGF